MNEIIKSALVAACAFAHVLHVSSESVCGLDDTSCQSSENSKSKIKRNHPNSKQRSPNPTCQIYLAKSSIPNAGLGIFTSVSVSSGDTATLSDYPIVVSDMEYHHTEDIVGEEYFDWLLNQYYWNGISTYLQDVAYSVSVAVPSFGMAGNHHSILHNMDMEIETDVFVPILDRRFTPNAGAVSDAPPISWCAIRDIEAGEELFLYYGENYFETRQETYADLPSSEDYEQADVIVSNFTNAMLLHDPPPSDPDGQKLWDMIREVVVRPQRRSVLPSAVEELEKMHASGSARHALPNSIRTTEWLKTNGMCMDNLLIGVSTIPNAGRGAFSTRFLSKGAFVSPAPLVHIPDGHKVDMVPLKSERLYEEPIAGDGVVGTQLLLNYVFGHKNSSMLLFPYATGFVAINHHKDPNVEIQWTTRSEADCFHQKEWLDTEIQNIPMTRAGLMFDVIALRDIHPGEEVFLDYGPEWEQAFLEHNEKWVQPLRADEYADPRIYNMLHGDKILLTVAEQETNAYPDNLQTVCMYYRQEEVEGMRIWAFEGEMSEKFMRPCVILNKEVQVIPGEDGEYLEEYFYTARMFNHGDSDEPDLIYEDEVHVVRDIPRFAIMFKGKPYSGNQYQENTFRHFIGVPEGIYPDIWMNK